MGAAQDAGQMMNGSPRISRGNAPGYGAQPGSHFTGAACVANHARMRVLVAGGTGMLGSPVVEALRAAHRLVRVLTRRTQQASDRFGSDVEVVAGDLTGDSRLADALHGCTALHVSLKGDPRASDHVAVENEGLGKLLAAAREAGVRRVTYLSGAGRIEGNEALFPVRLKLDAEEAIRSSGIPWTIFRATHFMESLDLFMQGGSATIFGDQPHAYHYLAASDFATMIVRALDTNLASGRILYAHGPQPFTMRQALERFVQCLHPGAKVRSMPIPLARALAAVTGNRDLKFASMLFAGFARIGESGDPREANILLGAPRMTLEEWLHRRSDAGRVH